VAAPTNVSDILEILEDGVDLWSVPRFLIPALLGKLPDRWGHSRGLKRARLRRSLALRDHNDDSGVRNSGIGHLSGRELEAKTVRTRTDTLSGKYAPPQQPLTRSIHRFCKLLSSSRHSRYL